MRVCVFGVQKTGLYCVAGVSCVVGKRHIITCGVQSVENGSREKSLVAGVSFVS